MRDFTVVDARASGQFGLITAAQLLEAGYTKRMVDHRVSEGLLRRRGRGVLQLAGTVESWEQDLLAVILSAGPAVVASHRAAARLWGFRSVDEELEFAVRRPKHPLVPERAILHRSVDLEPEDFTAVDGIPVTTPERTICDLGLIFPGHEVHRILMHAIAVGLVLPNDLWRMRERTSKQGRNGTGVLGRLLRELTAGFDKAESGPELLFLQLCDEYSILRPTPQLPIRIGGRDYRLDFAWAAKRIFVEIDGADFHTSPEQIARDGGRQNDLVRAGWTPLRFTYSDLRHEPGRVARLLRSVL